MASRPTYGDASRFVTSACSGWPSSNVGAGIVSSSWSNNGTRFSARPAAPGVSPAWPARALQYTIGNSIWLSSASRSRKSSYTSFTTSVIRASGRSTLLTTSNTGSRASSALRSTKRVCGSGPSLASTRSSTPSTMRRPRSTSPPKSAWPGVSTMLIFTAAVVDSRVLGQDRDALLALEIHRVQHTLGDVLVLAKRPRLPEHRVHERRLAVVDVRDDGDVAYVVALRHRPRVAARRQRAGKSVARAASPSCGRTSASTTYSGTSWRGIVDASG